MSEFTGKTYRACLKACLECSEGKNVLIVVDSKNKIALMKDKFKYLTLGISDVLQVHDYIIFPNKNTISIMTFNEVINYEPAHTGIIFNSFIEDLDLKKDTHKIVLYLNEIKKLKSRCV